MSRIVIDPEIADLVPMFLKHRRQDIETLRDAAAIGDLVGIARIAHDVKGTAGSYGFEHLSEIAAALEDAAMSGSGGLVRAGISALQQHLESEDVIDAERRALVICSPSPLGPGVA
jgi:HPt (histidine-containing phosphotransfer) domain-containing protein